VDVLGALSDGPTELTCFSNISSCSAVQPGQYIMVEAAANEGVYTDCTNVVLFKAGTSTKERVGVYCWSNSNDCYMGCAEPVQAVAAASGERISEAGPSGLPKIGVIPDEPTAVAVALAIFNPIWKKEYVDKFAPYRAQLRNNVWTVWGTLKSGSRGGTPQLRINKYDGKVLEIWHSQ
jgi:hypothetical protein